MDYSNWMSSIPALEERLLRDITLPATHDSGTYNLTDVLAQPLDSDEQKMEQLIAEAAAAIDTVQGIIEYIPQPRLWLNAELTPTIQGLMTATSQPISQQLRDGIRCLDLRIYRDSNSGEFYTYHTLVGSPLKSVLTELASFLRDSKAEIVYVTFSHFRGFSADDTEIVTSLCNKVRDYLGDDRIYDPGPQVQNPFDLPYYAIVNQNSTTPRSRAILVLSTMDSPDPLFLPESYSPPDNDDDDITHVVGGVYTDTDDLDIMIDAYPYPPVFKKGQKPMYETRNLRSPFAMFLILTPQDIPVAAILSEAMCVSMMTEAGKIPDKTVAAGLEMVASKFAQPPQQYSTLKNLSWKVDQNVIGLIEGIITQSTQIQPLSFIYVDFYETTGTSFVDYVIGINEGFASDRLARSQSV